MGRPFAGYLFSDKDFGNSGRAEGPPPEESP